MQTLLIVETGAAALLFGTVCSIGGRVKPLQALGLDHRSIVSLGAGMSAAYVFVHVMPELHSVRQTFAAAVSAPLRFQGMVIYFVALIGFLAFYGMDHLNARVNETDSANHAAMVAKLRIGGFAVYVWLMAYLLVNNLDETAASTALYSIAIAFHFLGVDYELRNEGGAAYQRNGRFVLAGMVLFGWGVGLLFALPRHVTALLMAFISGAIIMNTAIMELPSEKDGRFPPFLVGGIVYGLVLLPLG
jgi:hypothetical protein